MKFCYFDESGMGNESVLVMAGIIVDAQRMHVTKDVWGDFLDNLSKVAGRTIKEFHSRDFYRGNGPWRGLDGKQRSTIINAVIKWIKKRKHNVTFSTIHKEKYNELRSNNDMLNDLQSLWSTAAFHSLITLQKHHQKEKKTKGHTVLIFDHEVKHEKYLSNLVFSPPEWSHEYYEKSNKATPLNQIVDVPFFVDSEKVLLIQLADLIAYILRTHAEFSEGTMPEKYNDEAKKFAGWTDQILERALPVSTRYPSRGRCPVAQLFWDLAPECMRR